MNARELPLLTQFLGGWFHQDWADEGHATPADVVRAYAKDETPKAVSGTILEIDKLLSLRLPPTQMRRLLGDELGCAYDPTLDGKTFRAWLRDVHGILKKTQTKG